ncbi:hypothetical protein Patl1_17814 [Pistacia atlantica]|uniref:Uncharacterized protein n=1 Tax=Pistacia atlantica TaxID=434234 RepID=A0ACC1BY94_9ROSI|nr:hypothetical protein Patl1_17814 [Pistacia atlantica]
MSSQSSSRTAKPTEDEINHLISKLQPLLPQLNQRPHGTVAAKELLKEAYNYIRRLHGEIDDLSERISQLLNAIDTSDVDMDS